MLDIESLLLYLRARIDFEDWTRTLPWCNQEPSTCRLLGQLCVTLWLLLAHTPKINKHFTFYVKLLLLAKHAFVMNPVCPIWIIALPKVF